MDEHISGPTQTAVHELMRFMIEQNKHRDEQITRMLEQVTLNHAQAGPSHAVLPDLNSTVNTFDGESSDCAIAMEWITALETTGRLNHWPDTYTIEAARSRLTGAAKNWFLSRQSQLTTWSAFKASFVAMFVSEIDEAEQWKTMQNRTQQRGENVFAYFHDKIRLCRRLKLSEAVTKKMICTGLQSRDLSNRLLCKTYASEESMVRDIREFNEVESERVEKFSTGPRNDNSKDRLLSKDERWPRRNAANPKTNDQHQTDHYTTRPKMNIGTSTYKPPNKVWKTPVRCYNCQLSGHISRDCTQPRKPEKCVICKSEGHTASRCTNQPQVSLVDDQSTNGLSVYIKDVWLNQHTEAVQGLVDTGSSYSMIKRGVAERLSLKILPRTVTFRVYGNADLVVCGGETKTEVRIDDVSEKVTLLVVGDDVQTYDVIIGRNFCDNKNVTFVKTMNSLIFGYGFEFPFQHEQEISTTIDASSTQIVSSEERPIPANSVAVTRVCVGERKYEMMLANATDNEILLQKGERVGRLRSDKRIELVAANNLDIVQNKITEYQINYNQQFTAQQVNILVDLLNEYRQCFAFNLTELGCTNMVEMDIQVEGEPMASKPYRASVSEREIIDRIVSEWKAVGLASETSSPYASPVLLVTKKNGEPRLVVDYRRLNAQTIKKIYPTANMEDHLEVLKGAKMFTTLDLASGYMQVPLTEEAKAKTAFITPSETGQFERMMFGLVNAPYEFSRLMQRVMGPLRNRVAMWFLDDILIPANSFEDMIHRLREVLKALQNAHLTLKLSKCCFGLEEVSYLGLILTPEGIKPGIDKVAAIRDVSAPTNKHEIRRFLGLTGFFRRFIPRYAITAKPLTDLLKEDSTFRWSTLQADAFEALKHQLTTTPILQLYDQHAETEVHCDASSVGLSGMLLQRGNDKNFHLVHAVSKKTTEAEKNYHSGKLELLAIVWTVTRLRHLLIGIHFVVVTDCQSIVHLNTQKTVNPQIARWANLLSEYQYDIRHRPGVKMAHIDALSRAPTGESLDTEVEVEKCRDVFMVMTEEDHVLAMQRSDATLKRIIDILQKDPDDRTKFENQTVQNYELNNALLYKVVQFPTERKKMWVVPSTMRKSLVVKFHDLSGHFAVDRTVAKIQERYYFPRMRRYVKFHISCCPECALNKVPRGKRPGELHAIHPGRRPFEIINIDHVGPFVRSTSGKTHILVVIDNLTKYVKLYAVHGTGADPAIKALKDFVLNYGVPRRIISDRGTAFTANAFENFCQQRGIVHSLISVRHPQSNGQVERVNATLVTTLQANMTSDRTWDRCITEVESHLNNATNSTIGDTPFKVLYGYYPSIHDGALRNVTTEETWSDTQQLQQQIRAKILKQQEQWKKRYDTKHTLPVRYTAGDIVFLKRMPECTGESTKLQAKYRGPLVITKTYPNDSYRVAALRSSGKYQYATTAHGSMLKGYHLGTEEEDIQEGFLPNPLNIDEASTEETIQDQEESETDENQKDPPREPNTTSRPARERKRPSYLEHYV